MGVSGSGKTTVGHLLAQTLGWPFFEGDDFHPPANIAKMRVGTALSDADRRPWLLAIRAQMQILIEQRQHAVFACSALKRAYRDMLRLPGTRFVYLDVAAPLVSERVEQRVGHFFDPDLLTDQFAVLEEPEHALAVDAAQSPAQIVEMITRELGANET